ncbi:MAG: nucleoside deaminase [Ignavibacteriales bacterium]|nr:nucleoside deaminase [Ignavibacteriales bacterium]
MAEAIALSRRNIRERKGGPFGAVIVRYGEIIARGTNLVPSTNDPTAHAEITAIREACRVLKNFQLSDCEIYSSCEPCPMCLGAIYWARLRPVYFANTRTDAAVIGFDDELLYNEFTVPLSGRTIPMIQIMNAEALEVFREWNSLEDKITY